MSTDIAHPAIVFFAILGAGAVILIGFAVTHVYHRAPVSDHEPQAMNGEDDQAVYMRQVRLRNQQNIVDAYGYGYRNGR